MLLSGQCMPPPPPNTHNIDHAMSTSPDGCQCLCSSIFWFMIEVYTFSFLFFRSIQLFIDVLWRVADWASAVRLGLVSSFCDGWLQMVHPSHVKLSFQGTCQNLNSVREGAPSGLQYILIYRHCDRIHWCRFCA